MKEVDKGYDALSLGDFMDKYKRDEVTWKITKKYLSAYDQHKREIYYIRRDTCLTKDKQFDWLAHMCEKVWIYPYEFKTVFIKALKKWGLYE